MWSARFGLRRTAYVPIDDDENALNQPFGRLLEERFSAMAETGSFAPDQKAVNDLATAAEHALAQYGGEADRLVAGSIREDFQLGDGEVIDRTAYASGTSEDLRAPEGQTALVSTGMTAYGPVDGPGVVTLAYG